MERSDKVAIEYTVTQSLGAAAALGGMMQGIAGRQQTRARSKVSYRSTITRAERKKRTAKKRQARKNRQRNRK